MENNHYKEVFDDRKQYDLYSDAVAPSHVKNVSPRGIGIIWFGMAVQVSVFAAFAQFPQYYSLWECLILYLVGAVLVGLFCIFTQDIGLKHGISFAVSICAPFGYRGGRLVGIVRAAPMMVWFSLNCYIGAEAINELMKIFFSFDSMPVSFVINLCLLIIVTSHGVKGIERIGNIITPIMMVVGIYLMYALLDYYNLSFFEALQLPKLGNPSKSYLYGIGVVIGSWSSVVVGMNDFTKDSPIRSEKWVNTNLPYTVASLSGIVPFLTLFTLLGSMAIVFSGGRTDVITIFSEIVQSKSIILAAFIQFFIVIAQMSTNTASNLLPSAYIACGIFRKLRFTASVILVAILSCLLQPWNYMDKLDLALALFGTSVGPILGIIAADYYVFRKRKLNVMELYRSQGIYMYYKGYNLTALVICFSVTAISYLFFMDSSFFVGMALAFILYIFAAPLQAKKYPITTKES